MGGESQQPIIIILKFECIVVFQVLKIQVASQICIDVISCRAKCAIWKKKNL